MGKPPRTKTTSTDEARILLRALLLVIRQRMGDGSRSEKFCLACVETAPHKQPGDCKCPCHPAWALIHRADEESRAA